MKRGRTAEHLPLPSTEAPAKVPRHHMNPSMKSSPAPAPKHSHRQRNAASSKQKPAEAAHNGSPSMVKYQEEAQPIDWEVPVEVAGRPSWSSWAIDEDVLSGWFPFVDEHFICSKNRGSVDGCLYVDEEEEEYLHDLWQLHKIHEVPN